MILEKELGGYSRSIVRMYGSFEINGTSDPDEIRDGKSALIKSVVRTSAGLFTVTIASDFPIPEKLIHATAHLHTSATPTIIAQANVVVDSYSQSARTFQVVTYHTSGTPGVGDPDDEAKISFELVGSINSAGTDAA